MTHLTGPLNFIPEFTVGIGYGMVFMPCKEKETDVTTRSGEKLTVVGSSVVTGPDVYTVTMYKSEKGCFYYD